MEEHEGNAKIHDRENVDAIKASIERFGNCDPIGVWTNPEGKRVIVEGHGRKLALSELGHDTAPCIFLDHLTDEERRAYGLAHNQTTLMSGFDLDALSLEMEDLDGFEMEEFGFPSFDNLEDFFDDPEEKPEEKPEQESEEEPEIFELKVECRSEEDREKLAKELEGNGYKCSFA